MFAVPTIKNDNLQIPYYSFFYYKTLYADSLPTVFIDNNHFKLSEFTVTFKYNLHEVKVRHKFNLLENKTIN